MPAHPRALPVALTLALAGGAAAGLDSLAAASPAAAAPSASTVSAAARRTMAVGSEHFTMRLSITRTGSSAAHLTLSAVGVADNGPVTSAATDLHLHLARYGTAQLRLVDAVVYARLPAKLEHQLPAQLRGWLAVNLNAVAKAQSGKTLSQLSAAAPAPVDLLSELRKDSTTVTDVGSGSIRGVPTTEYVANLDLAKLVGANAVTAVQVRRIQAALGTTTVPVEVWVDHQGRVRQVHLRLSLSNQALSSVASSASAAGTAGSGQPGGTSSTARGTSTFSFTIDQFGFGHRLAITPPPANQVHDLTSQVISATKAASSSATKPSSGAAS